jgi:hypothetical protein
MDVLTGAALIIVALRLVVPLYILRRPLLGGIVAMLLDAADVILVEPISRLLGEPSGFGEMYHMLDKLLDLYYLSLEAWVSLRWTNTLARRTSLLLYAYRLAGMVLYELTGIRKLLFFFPNLFENFFLYHEAARRHFPRFEAKTVRQVLAVLAVLYVPKLAQEYVLHVRQMQPWHLFKQVWR